MLRNFLQNYLAKSGKTYKIDASISNKMLFAFIVRRVLMMIRGLLKTQNIIFLGRNVKILNKKNFDFGKSCTIEKYVKIDCYSKNKVVFGNVVKIGAYSTISITSHLSSFGYGLVIGSNTAVGEYSYFGCSGGVKIGNDVIMGQYISFHSQNHNFENPDLLIREQGVKSEGIVIGNNIWVGAKVTFLDGCILSDNTVVAAGAVVKGKFPPNVVIGGVPAKVIKQI